MIALILIPIGTISSLIYFENKKEAPIRAQARYLENAADALFSENQSIAEILSSFQIAGAKVQIVDNLKESTASSAGFFVSLDDLEKSVSKIELASRNLENQKLSLGQNNTPTTPAID